MPDRTPPTEMCSCSSTTVVRVHSSGSYCADAQHERLADALREMRTLATDADADVEAAASDFLDALRKEPAPVPTPAPVVRSDRIELAAQVFCDSSRNGQRWVDLSEPFRDLYRRRVRALAEAGLLVDAPAKQPSSVDRRGHMPAEIPAAEPEPCVITDAAGDRIVVDSKPGDPHVVIWAFEGGLLTLDQAVDHARAVLAHVIARRADANGSVDA